MVATPAVPKPSTLDEVLAILTLSANAASVAGGPVGAGAQLAAILLQIAQKAAAAYEAQAGKPIDPSLLKPEPLIS